jgi:eukaryotic-like serine/threonine-protein kinase
MLLTPGTRLGPYTIESLIGSGGMGEVYKAHDGRLNRTVAIKRMIAGDVSRFQSEARAIAGRVEEDEPRIMAHPMQP